MADRAALASLYESASARLPSVSLDREVFAAFVGERFAEEPPSAELAEDLFLACACLARDARALEELDKRHLARVPQFVARIEPSAAGADEVTQRLRERLLVPGAAQTPKLAEYQGRGPLGAWIRVAAIRVALNLRAAEKPGGRAAADERLADDDPELGYLRARYAAQFQEAVAHALGQGAERDRTMLRLHLIDGLGIDRIGQLYDVHRATAARWQEHARRELFERTRARLGELLGVSETEFESIVKLVQSELDVSLCRLLAESPSP
jgi:RNA polymerase sigma-70 factor, ECF subfamily